MKTQLGVVVGVNLAVACLMLQGCKAPKSQEPNGNEVAVVEAQNAPEPAPVVAPAPAPAPVVEKAPATPPPPPPKAIEPAAEYTYYTIKAGDTLSGICVAHGLRQSKVVELNPGMNPNRLLVGRKIKLPGKIDLGAEPAAKPAKAAKGAKAKPAAKAAAVKAPKTAGKAAYKPYTGATKEYVVKNGDFVGKIAQEYGITIRAFKELNGLAMGPKGNALRVGQKLKVPAEKQSAAPAPEAAVKPATEPAAPKASEAPAPAPAAEPAAEPAAAPEAVPAPAAEPAAEPAAKEAAAPAAPVETYTVKEGEDAVSIAINYNIGPGQLLEYNGISADDVKPGVVLKIPPKSAQ